MEEINLSLKPTELFQNLNWEEVNIPFQFNIPLEFYAEIDLTELKNLDIFERSVKNYDISNIENSQYYQTFLTQDIQWFWVTSKKERFIFWQPKTDLVSLIRCHKAHTSTNNFYLMLSSADLIFEYENRIVKAVTENAGLTWKIGEKLFSTEEIEYILSTALNVKIARPNQIAQAT